jgi:DNA-binding transcriptional LysR family regulator
VDLTSAGARLLDALVPSMQRIDTAVQQIRAQADRPSLVVTTWASFASIWLIPRLDSFRSRHPEIDIHVRTTNSAIDLEAHESDIALRYTRETAVQQGSVQMFDDLIVAVASPLVLKDGKNTKSLDSPQNLHQVTLIEAGDTHTNQRLAWLTWHGWAKANKLPDLSPKRWIYFYYSQQVVQACLSGHGVALSRLPLVAYSLARGELVEVLPRYRLTSPMGYWIVTSARNKARPEIVALTKWLLEEAKMAKQNMSRIINTR